MTDDRRTWAIIPLRGLETAKTRLGPALDAGERLELVIEMANRTLIATRDAAAISGTVLVTADVAAAELARTFGALTLVQRLPGLNAALREARTEAVRRGATATIVIPIDLPAIDAASVDDLVAQIVAAAGGAATVVALVPDRHGRGTNVLYTAPPAVIEPQFGEGSLDAHRLAAAAAGARLVELGGPLVLDVDTGDDLLVAEGASASGTSVEAASSVEAATSAGAGTRRGGGDAA